VPQCDGALAQALINNKLKWHQCRMIERLQFNPLYYTRLVAVEAFGDGKALFPTGFVKFFRRICPLSIFLEEELPKMD
jgi:hypothetical protein